jgi:outer membrane protein
MNRSFMFICLLASGLGVNAMAQTAAASATDPTPNAPTVASAAVAPAGPTKVAIIMFQPAVAKTNEGQRDFSELRTKFTPKQTQLSAQNTEIEALKKQLQAGGTTLSEADRSAKLKALDEKEKALQHSAEEAQTDFQGQMNETYQKLAEKVYQVMQDYVKQQGYTLVVDASAQQSPVLWANPSTDITQAVIEAYNTKSGVPAPAANASATAPATHSNTTPAHPAGTSTAHPAPKQ